MEKQTLLYTGKAKSLYKTEDSNVLWVEFRDDTSAFNGKKLEQLSDKGAVNNAINAKVMSYLEGKGIRTHLVKKISPTESLVRPLKMLPVECVIRNIAAGSLTKRLGIEAGTELSPPLFETFLKDDELGDPMVAPSHVVSFGYATAEQLTEMEAITRQVNTVLSEWFAEHQMKLVDFKLEFGLDDAGQLVLGDEVTPDGCRIWDMANDNAILDKDRFRQGLGNVIESYQIIAKRLEA